MSAQTLGETLNSLQAAYRVNAELKAKLAEARAVLREVEWAGNPDHTCPVCEGMPDDEYGSRVLGIPHGHAPDCRIAQCLRE